MSGVSLRTYRADDIEYDLYEQRRAGSTTSTLLVFVHGNGLCRAIFRRMIAETLACYPANEDVLAITLDLGGHGQSTQEVIAIRTKVSHYAPDVITCVEDAKRRIGGVSKTVLVGHSVGAHISLLAHLQKPLFNSAFLIEPMILNQFVEAGPSPIIESTLRRRVAFPNNETAVKLLASRGIFKDWELQCVADYVEGGTRQPDPSKPDVVLTCSPQTEVKNYLMDVSEIYGKLGDVDIKNVIILEGDISYYLPDGHLQEIATRFKYPAKYERIPEVHHVMQCEKPQLLAHMLVNFLSPQRAKL